MIPRLTMYINWPVQMHDVVFAIMMIADLKLSETRNEIYTFLGYTSYLPTTQGKVFPLKVINPHSESR